MINSNGAIPSLQELLPPERMKFGVCVQDWKEAIQIAGRILVSANMVEGKYIDAMIRTAEELGPYIVIAPGVALPHARPEEGVKRTALSFVSLDTPIAFGNTDNDPVHVVIALAAQDKKTHTKAMQVLAELLLSRELLDRLTSAAGIEEVQRVFREAEDLSNE